MAFWLCVDSRNFPATAKANSITSQGKLSICIVWYLDICHKATWHSVFAFTWYYVSLTVSRAVSAFSGVMLQLFVGVLRPSPGLSKAKVTVQSESLQECTCRLKEERLLVSNWCSLRGIVCMYISLLPAFPLFLNLFQV